MAVPTELMWALVGLLLTIGGTFLEAQLPNPPWDWGANGIHSQPLPVTYQVGAVLLVGCLGGRNAALISQIAYLALGLVGFPIFGRGGGLSYWQEPTFGYLLGFIPGAWLCGYLAFKRPARLESLAFSCVCGLVSIHLVGLVYLTLGHLFHWWADPVTTSLWSEIRKYSVNPLPGQLIVVCVATVLGYLLRYLMFY